MEQNAKLDMYLIANQKYFPSSKMMFLKEKLATIDESRWSMLSTIELKDPTTILLISIFLGGLGIDRFMIGDTGIGILKLLTGGCCGFLAIYDWFTISEQFEACKLMSDSDVAKENSRKVQAPGSPLSVLKDKGKVVVKITSIAFFGETAQVRFTSEKLNASGENVDNSPLQKWIATIAFQFKPGMMTEQQRLVNPLGFKAATYRVDPEVIK